MQGLRCPPSCRCWPRPGPFTPKEVMLLTHLSQWASSTNLEDWVPFGHGDLIDDLARDTSADRVGYVLSVPLALCGDSPGHVMGGSVLYRCVEGYVGARGKPKWMKSKWMRFIQQVLRYGVCLETSYWFGAEHGRPWRPRTRPEQHPGRAQATGLSPQAFCWDVFCTWGDVSAVSRAAEASVALRQAGQANHKVDRWIRWHSPRAEPRRHWLALCTALRR